MKLNIGNEYRHLKAKAKRTELTEQERQFVEMYEDNKQIEAALRELQKMIDNTRK